MLGIGGPKRLVITVLAATTVSTSGLGSEAKLVISAAYVLIATMLVSVPVMLFLVKGDQAGEWVDTARERFMKYRSELTFYSLVVFGGFFCIDAVVRLL